MNILKVNTAPSFEIVPRTNINLSNTFRIELENNFTNETQSIQINSLTLLPNENYTIVLASFPVANLDAKFSYTIKENIANNVICIGKLMVVSENENVQDYKNNKYFN